MNSFWKKLFGFPDLLHFASNTTFLFQFLPLGPPSFEKETAGNANEISGDLTLPLSIRMFAPENGQYTPYVEFRTLLSGPSKLNLGSDGKVQFKIAATEQPITYAFATTYFQYRKPTTRIAVNTIANAARSALNTDGLALAIPPLKVGANLVLSPTSWDLENKSVLHLNFRAKPETTTSRNIKTSNGKTLSLPK